MAKKKNISVFNVPFVRPKGGNWRMAEYDFSWHRQETEKEYRLNAPFNAKLQFIDWHRSQNRARLVLKDVVTGTEYSLFEGEILDVIKKSTMGEIEGNWQVAKRGSKFGLVYHGDPV